jgi:hypothetical protein
MLHKLGILHTVETERVISEMPTQQAIYESLIVPDDYGIIAEHPPEYIPMDIEMQRRHA